MLAVSPMRCEGVQLAGWDVRIDEWSPFEAAGRLSIVIEGIRGTVVRVVPWTGCDAVPPGVAVRDRETRDLAGDLNGVIGGDLRSFGASRIFIVGPCVNDAARRLGIRGFRWPRGCRWCDTRSAATRATATRSATARAAAVVDSYAPVVARAGQIAACVQGDRRDIDGAPESVALIGDGGGVPFKRPAARLQGRVTEEMPADRMAVGGFGCVVGLKRDPAHVCGAGLQRDDTAHGRAKSWGGDLNGTRDQWARGSRRRRDSAGPGSRRVCPAVIEAAPVATLRDVCDLDGFERG